MLRLPRSVWIQLAILAVVTVIAVGVMAFGFANVPALLGIGRYNVMLDPALVQGIDRAARTAGVSRSDFIAHAASRSLEDETGAVIISPARQKAGRAARKAGPSKDAGRRKTKKRA